MDAERITELLTVHGNVITWESHLEFVGRMSHWEPEEIVDYQETLLDHLARGSWVTTSQNRIVVTTVVTSSSDYLANMISMYETLLAIDGTPQEQTERWEAELETYRAWQPVPLVDVFIPDGSIGVPFHPWTMDPRVSRHYDDPVRERAQLIKYMNDPDQSGSATNELRLVLRAAPWAYLRRTGQRLPGVDPCALEEFHRTGRHERFTTVVTLRRGGDLAEYLAFTPAPSADAAAMDRSGYFKAFARLLGASIIRVDSRAIDGVHTDELRWLVQDARVISDRQAEPMEVEPNALSVELGKLLFTTTTDRSQHQRLDEEAFWKLIALIDDDLSDESVDRLTRALAKKPLKSIIGFHETLTDILYRLDRPEMTKPPGSSEPSMMSDDVFLYFRCAVIARGREAVSDVLAAGGIVEDDWLGDMGESLLSVAPNAFELKTGEPFEHETEFSYESASNTQAWGGEPAPKGELPVEAFSVRSHSIDEHGMGRERVRYWATPSRDEAHASHDSAELELWGANYRGIIDSVPLPLYDGLSITKALARVSYYRALAGSPAN